MDLLSIKNSNLLFNQINLENEKVFISYDHQFAFTANITCTNN
jgi:hypothetical protein